MKQQDVPLFPIPINSNSIPPIVQATTWSHSPYLCLSQFSYPMHQQILLTISRIQLLLTISITTTPNQTCHLILQHDFFRWLQKLFQQAICLDLTSNSRYNFLPCHQNHFVTFSTGYIIPYCIMTRHDACLVTLHCNHGMDQSVIIICLLHHKAQAWSRSTMASRTTKLFVIRKGNTTKW